MDIKKCNGCGALFDFALTANKLNGAVVKGHKNACSSRCQPKVFPRLERTPEPLQVNFMPDWRRIVPIDHNQLDYE